MSSSKELKDRINAVKETRKITGAMYLISSTKLRRAKVELAAAKPYFELLGTEIESFLRVDETYESRRFRTLSGAPVEGGVCGALVVTADKGLAGAYNANVLHAAEELLAAKPDAKLFVLGDYGRRYFAQHRGEAMTYLGAMRAPTRESARELADDLLKRLDDGELNEISVIYTDMKNSLASEVRTHWLLPFARAAAPVVSAADGGHGAATAQTEFLPSTEEVVDTAVRTYVRGFLYGALLDSYCSEQNARVTAMDSANANAQELLGDLSLQLNRTRQAAITREITEISAGAQAQKKARKKKGGA